MNVIQAIDSLRNDLDRTIESLEALRTGFANYALVAPFLNQPKEQIDPAELDDRLKGFLDEHCQRKEGAYVRVRALWQAYLRWCRLREVPPISQQQLNQRMIAAGYQYSRSRRIRGHQVRTWENLTLAKTVQ